MSEFLWGVKRGLFLVIALFVLPAQAAWYVVRAVFRSDGCYMTVMLSQFMVDAWEYRAPQNGEGE